MQFKKYNLLFALIFAVSLLYGQNTHLKKAEKLYAGYSYPESSEQFEKITDKTPEVLRKLADSYFYAGDYEKAEEYYAQVASSAEKTRDDVYQYAYVLEINQKYDEANKQMQNFARMAPDDSRAKRFSSNPEYRNILLKDNERFVIQNLKINSQHQDFAAYFQNEGQVVFASTRQPITPVVRKWNWNELPFLDLYVAKIDSGGELTQAEKFYGKINKKYHEGPAAFTPDGNFMAYTRNNYDEKSSDGVVKLELYFSEYKDEKWQKPVAFEYNNKEYSVGHADIADNGNTLYFVSDMPGSVGGSDIWVSRKSEDGKWSKPENLGKTINTEGKEMFPFMHESGYFFFASDGHPGLGGLDIFYTKYKNGQWAKPINLGVPVNSSYDDFSLTADAEMKHGYFASNRPGGKGDDDIYAFTMMKPFGITIEGYAKDTKGNILAGTEVKFYDNSGKLLETVEADSKGYYSFTAEPDKNYRLSGEREKYTKGENTASTRNTAETVRADVILEKIPDLRLRILVTDKNTGEPIEGVSIQLTDQVNSKQMNFSTAASGDYKMNLAKKKINDELRYEIACNKKGYANKQTIYEKRVDKEGTYKVHIEMEKMDVGLDLAKLVNLKPIYFDLNKYNIRPDAAVELDKIVKIMNEYPTMEVELGSHTDSRGSDLYNLRLSQRRATASAKYIKDRITNPDRITGKGYGETRLVNKCDDGVPCSDEEHQANRRTEFKITKM